MLDQLLGLIKENSQQAIVQNPAVPDSQNTEVMQTLLGSITGGFQQQAQAGNIQGLMGLLSGNSGSNASSLMNNPIVASIATNAISAIVQKFGLSNSAAGGIVSSVLPGVIGSLISKVGNPNDSSFDFNSVLGGLLGGNQTQSGSSGFDFNQIGSALADGKLDMNDLIRVGGSLMGGGAKGADQDKQQQGGVDLGGLLGGLFGGK
ncbi:hypothetical protein DSL64_01090 [Dyadobacter luteus]|jgi:hypothetical protein|uniref:DUF937 domain-containing protein n=1 Tax=Dyadobacter luteus TaxID=2259619 RepID=A0A3D8YI13_9BACT|nr:hypothetical protein [Dyadobacter luteus]REA64180.1 hypothetical protein DSL64_01090 [Dyadobacter luteus]